ncbi:MAG: hypothetical protein LBJ89_01945, partial [Holosporales bacterium]|nr:hypothetical protein [Holosporales bacterium]
MFNNVKFLEDVRKVHLQSKEELAEFDAVTDVRTRLNDMTLCEFVGDELTLIHCSLDNICANFVGETMFRLLVAKKDPKKLNITNIAIQEEQKELVKQLGSSYGDGEVQINLNLYDKFGIGIKERQYYCIDQYNVPSEKPKSVEISLFHEFTHCLHDAEDHDLYNHYSQPHDGEYSDEEKVVWSNCEEQRTIAGFIAPNTYDPICENCFDLCHTTSLGTKFRPRIGHFGPRKGVFELYD